MDDPLLRPACQSVHKIPAPAETWSPVFGCWLCRDCLERLSVAELCRVPGAALDLEHAR